MAKKYFLKIWRNMHFVRLEETPYSHLPYFDFGDSMINDKQQMKKKVFVSGCYDLLHSGHVEFFQQASRYGDLYVGIGSDATYLEYKHRKPMFPQEERLFMVKNIKAVKDAYINEGSGVIDFLPTLDKVKPDVFVVNAEGGSDDKRRICKERGIEYVELQRTPHAGLKARSSSDLNLVMIPMEPRRPGCSVVEGKDITPEKVKALADAADACWKAILAHNLDAFAATYKASFEAQIAMFPGMVNPSINGVIEPEASVQPMIDRYSRMEEVLAWKMPGAGGGGYLALVVKDSNKFAENHDEAIHLQIRRA